MKNDKELLRKHNDVFAEQLKQGIIEEAPEDYKWESVTIYVIMLFFERIKTLAK